MNPDDAFLSTCATWILIFLIYSFVGWLFEVVVGIVLRHKITNRGFMIGPFCPIYGFGALIISLLLGHIQNIAVIFCVAVIGATILEYTTSYFMEKTFRARWWDYSHEFCNLNGRVCLKASLMFGLLGTFVVCIANPLLTHSIECIDPVVRVALAALLLGFMIADYLVSLWLMINFRLTVGLVSRDGTEEISERVHEIIWGKGPLERRIAKAFPDYQPKRVVKKTSKKSAKKAAKASAKTSKARKPSRTR